MRLVVRGFYWGEHLKNGARGTGPCGGGKCSPEIASSVWWQVGSDKPAFLPLGRRLQAGPGKRSPLHDRKHRALQETLRRSGRRHEFADCFRMRRLTGPIDLLVEGMGCVLNSGW